ncbi:MAG TPA: IS66 family transposase zinc-finger binding domain-containing protein [Steroidobacteraceae bacterium]|nr:IS66 family transposase zinc-finger binding domain-containing protein [Steroidobacteraceae bacterium]
MLIERERIIAEKETQLAERDRVIAVRDAELYAKTLQIEHLKAQLAVLRRARFGRSSEKLDREIEQLELVLGELEESVAESNARTEQAKQERASPARAKPADRKPGGRKPLPAHLPREQVIHQPPPACVCCGGKVLRKIADDLTEVLEYVPSSFKVMQHVRPKLSCRDCETIVSVRPSTSAISSSRMICSLFDWQIKDTWGRRRDPPVRRGAKRGLAGEGLSRSASSSRVKARRCD